MKHSKANTVTPPVFVNNKNLHEARIQQLDDKSLAFVCAGGGRYLPTNGIELTREPCIAQLTEGIWNLLGVQPWDNLDWEFKPVTLLTNVLLTVGLITSTALITNKITKSKKNNTENNIK